MNASPFGLPARAHIRSRRARAIRRAPTRTRRRRREVYVTRIGAAVEDPFVVRATGFDKGGGRRDSFTAHRAAVNPTQNARPAIMIVRILLALGEVAWKSPRRREFAACTGCWFFAAVAASAPPFTISRRARSRADDFAATRWLKRAAVALAPRATRYPCHGRPRRHRLAEARAARGDAARHRHAVSLRPLGDLRRLLRAHRGRALAQPRARSPCCSARSRRSSPSPRASCGAASAAAHPHVWDPTLRSYRFDHPGAKLRM